MNKICQRIIQFLIVFGMSLNLQALNIQWEGDISNNLFNPNNWSPAQVPVVGDSGIFNGTSTSTTPSIGSLNTITPSEFVFNDPTSFVFSIIGNGNAIDFQGAGIVNTGGALQTFNISGGPFARLRFRNGGTSNGALINVANDLCVVDYLNTSGAGTSTINITNLGRVQIRDSSSLENATINMTASGIALFQENGNGGNAIINADNSIISYQEDSSAGSSVMNMSNGSSLTYESNSTAGNSITNASGSSIDFSDASTGGTSTINLATSSLTISHDVAIGALSADAASTIDLGSFQLTVGGNGGTQTIAAPLTGTIATFIKTGNGTVNLTGDSSAFTSLTRAQQGILSLNGILGGDLLVGLGGTLSGTGSVLGNVTVNGMIMPGNGSVGTLSIGENYIQNDGSTYTVFIDGTNSSLLDIDGTATIQEGSRLNVPNLNNIVFGQPYLVLHTDGGVTGTYSFISPSFARAIYDPFNIFLLFQLDFQNNALTFNQRAVAAQLDSITSSSPALFTILSALDALPADDQRRVLDEMSGVQYANLMTIAELSNQRFIRRLYNPLRGIMGQSLCSCPLTSCGPLEVWVDGSAGHTHLNRTTNATGFKINEYEIDMGAQTQVDRWTLGGAVSYEYDRIHYDVSGKGKRNNVFGGLYSLYRPSGYYVLGDIACGYSCDHITRNIDIDSLRFSAKGNPKVLQSAAYVEAGKDYYLCHLLIQPFIGVEAGYYRRSSIREHGAGPLDLCIAKKSYGSAYTRFGFHFTTPEIDSYACDTLLSRIRLAGDLVWQHRWTNSQSNLNEIFQDFGDAFVIKGINMQRDSLDGTLFISAEVKEGIELFATFSGQLWNRASSYNGLIGIKTNW